MKNLSKCAATAAICLSLMAIQGVAADRVRVVNEGGIRDEWMLADGVKLAAPGYPGEFVERGDNVCVAMGYSIKPDGSTSDFSLIKAWSSSSQDKEPVEGFWNAFSQASAQALSQWKFKPRPEVTNPQPTYTVATMTFMGKEATDAAGLRSKCGITDLKAVIQDQKVNKFLDSKDRIEMESMRRDMQRQQAAAAARAVQPGVR